jgi:hypothetical protein
MSMLLRPSTRPQLRCEAYGLGRCPKLNGRAVDDNGPCWNSDQGAYLPVALAHVRPSRNVPRGHGDLDP